MPALIVGAFVPDLEVPFVWLLTGTQDRLILHSLIGSLALGTTIAVGLTVLAYPWVSSRIFHIDKGKVKEKCSLSFAVIFSCLLGVLSHVFLDATNHLYNPLWWPLPTLYASPVVLLLGGEVTASIVIHATMAVLFVGLFFNSRGNFWERLLLG